MGGILTLLVIVYLVGIGVVLAPTVQREWNTSTASGFVGSIVQELPVAAAWPVALYHRMFLGRRPGNLVSEVQVLRDAISHATSGVQKCTGVNSRATVRRIHELRKGFGTEERNRGYRVVTSSKRAEG
jgi:hypothetical protein